MIPAVKIQVVETYLRTFMVYPGEKEDDFDWDSWLEEQYETPPVIRDDGGKTTFTGYQFRSIDKSSVPQATACRCVDNDEDALKYPRLRPGEILCPHCDGGQVLVDG